MVGSASQAEEDAAVGLIRAVQWWCGVAVGDAKWRRAIWMRRQAVQLWSVVQTALARSSMQLRRLGLLEPGLVSIDDLISICGTCRGALLCGLC